MLQPKTNWYWYTQQHKLCISLGRDLEFTTAFNLDKLVNTPHKPCLFSLENYEWYLQIADKLEESGIALSGALKTQILLNACAALAFHRPMSPKSWYFEVQDTYGVNKQLALLEGKAGKGIVLALEQESCAVTCMLLSDDLQLNETKSLRQFHLIKVMSNRLIPYIAETAILKSA